MRNKILLVFYIECSVFYPWLEVECMHVILFGIFNVVTDGKLPRDWCAMQYLITHDIYEFQDDYVRRNPYMKSNVKVVGSPGGVIPLSNFKFSVQSVCGDQNRYN